MSAKVKCIMFLFLLVVLQPISIDGKSAVIIKNTIEGNLNLTIHCKSKDDDLGPVVLSPNQSYQFTFNPNFFRTTLFFCTFRWTGSCHWFDIYIQTRDLPLCEDIPCSWIIKKNGPCRDLPSSNKCFSWNPDTCSVTQKNKRHVCLKRLLCNNVMYI
ncbi:hypothetical protein HN51_005826 [Arachis hypogaea]